MLHLRGSAREMFYVGDAVSVPRHGIVSHGERVSAEIFFFFSLWVGLKSRLGEGRG